MTIRRPTLTTCGMLLTALLFSLSDSAAQDTRPKLTTLYSGAGSQARLVIGSGGILYGTTSSGGTGCIGGCGTVFSLAPPASTEDGWTENLLYDFTTYSDGYLPNGVVIGNGGVLYGTTRYGGTGACNCGTVFSLTPPASPGGAWTKTLLYSFTGIFTGGNDGYEPSAGVVIGNGGVLYGTTGFGGAKDLGTAFMLGTSHKETVLHAFTGGADGASPNGSLVSVKGVLYGTTSGGGKSDNGTVFSVNKAGKEQVLYAFKGGSDGYQPIGGLVNVNGMLYGATARGGHAGKGTVFSLRP